MKKKEQVVFKHIFNDYMTWSIWFLSIMVLVHIISVTAISYFGIESISWSILGTISQAAPIFLLILGIMNMGGILAYLTSNGVTRRDYFVGTSKAAVFISFILAVVAVLLLLIETMIFTMFGWQLIESITVSGLFITFISLVLRLTLFFFIGWLISAGFYKYPWLIGMLFIVIGVFLVSVSDFVWGDQGNRTFEFLPERDLPMLVAIIVSFILIAVTMWIIRLVTKHIRVKV
ncbi:hypothetical protein [Alkalicoccobacillus porphyridii]|uniref:Uncharacterized protein n=1 Tax=Alkalicoccobacillus porphyridii TaxID=2597270 RepID=A0A553ZU33_9BACI|nr:hypothetical protein [Alkalicoccobacillus porphyridii]TSB44913.1 hypothetical protein FN960_18875 [Alkalicoccobacillus porphyridii]